MFKRFKEKGEQQLFKYDSRVTVLAIIYIPALAITHSV